MRLETKAGLENYLTALTAFACIFYALVKFARSRVTELMETMLSVSILRMNDQ